MALSESSPLPSLPSTSTSSHPNYAAVESPPAAVPLYSLSLVLTQPSFGNESNSKSLNLSEFSGSYDAVLRFAHVFASSATSMSADDPSLSLDSDPDLNFLLQEYSSVEESLRPATCSVSFNGSPTSLLSENASSAERTVADLSPLDDSLLTPCSDKSKSSKRHLPLGSPSSAENRDPKLLRANREGGTRRSVVREKLTSRFRAYDFGASRSSSPSILPVSKEPSASLVVGSSTMLPPSTSSSAQFNPGSAVMSTANSIQSLADQIQHVLGTMTTFDEWKKSASADVRRHDAQLADLQQAQQEQSKKQSEFESVAIARIDALQKVVEEMKKSGSERPFESPFAFSPETSHDSVSTPSGFVSRNRTSRPPELLK